MHLIAQLYLVLKQIFSIKNQNQTSGVVYDNLLTFSSIASFTYSHTYGQSLPLLKTQNNDFFYWE